MLFFAVIIIFYLISYSLFDFIINIHPYRKHQCYCTTYCTENIRFDTSSAVFYQSFVCYHGLVTSDVTKQLFTKYVNTPTNTLVEHFWLPLLLFYLWRAYVRMYKIWAAMQYFWNVFVVAALVLCNLLLRTDCLFIAHIHKECNRQRNNVCGE